MAFSRLRASWRMSRRVLTTLSGCLYCGLLASAPSIAATAPGTSGDRLSLTEALQLAESRSARRVASDHAITSASERAVSAAQPSDPVLRAGIDNLPIAGADRFSLGRDFMTMRRIGVMQELTAPGKRALRRERGEQTVALERAMGRVAESALRREVAAAWLDRAYETRVSLGLESLRAEVQLQVRTLEASLRSTPATPDLRAAQAMLLQVEDQLAASRQQERIAVRMLERWLGEDAVRPPGELPDTAVLGADTVEALTALTHHAEIAVARESEALAATDVRLAKQSLTPDWSVEVAYQQRGPGFPDMVSFGVSVPLPLFASRRQDREIRASQAALAQAQAVREDLEREHRADVRARLEEWRALGERIARLETSLVPLAAERSALALTAYRGGTGTLVQTLEARRAEIEARLQILGLQRARAQVWTRLRYLTPADGQEAAK